MKKKITMQELKSIIKEEAQKLQRRTILEGEKKKLMEELGMIKNNLLNLRTLRTFLKKD